MEEAEEVFGTIWREFRMKTTSCIEGATVTKINQEVIKILVNTSGVLNAIASRAPLLLS